MAMTSIVGNSALITKVYVPKYIYPLSRVMSSGINFLISLVPLIIIVIIMRLQITPAIFLILYPIVCVFVYSLGLGLFLASVMVFFRDTQFLYGIFLTLWMYMTPIFYPASIIPENLRFVLKFNPMYHYITYARTVILDGMVPGMDITLNSGIYAVVAIIFGIFIFKKTQDKFVLHI